ncbi:MAG: histidinol-phosphate transaminase [Bacteroidetes bacterium]|nr:histidinol-phosphate transaminase [Bacteroidota bacterium]
MKIMENLLRDNIKKLQPYSSARNEFTAQAEVYLDANENPINNGINRYPDPYQNKLKERVSELKNIAKEKIFFGNGSDEVLDLTFRTFCEPGKDNVIICPPTYTMYKVLADINNIEVKEVILNNDFSLNTNKIISVVDENTKLLILCSPNNPTGNSIKKSDLELLLSKLNCIVLVDEAYIDFSDKESAIDLIDKYPNLIICQTLSKAWGMAGIRVGMAFTSTKIAEILNKVKPPYNINTLSQQKAFEGLRNKSLYFDILNMILTQKKLLMRKLKEFNNVEEVYPSDANFLLVKFTNSKSVLKKLQKNGIIVRDRSKQVLCENCLRITVGTEKENNKLITKLKEIEK